ncbi:hypothetical protein F441_13315 [Phytophthora nicotianae CJ01A1]|uniref:BZIP domain-containing protein n=2 Tax=Phytophthora nicotianae TaxID=4792 RepID=W2IN80_PHYNI|nr:hypothetical protein L915_13068 [Phytophthora nicotianae]ETL34848.1 hypothetical protein L916_12970 [Phytophthora nicotianae]ETP11152.1 hypothetical protein F441_13315 [Phytophthora nicotianae CJ01A1]
MIDSITSHASFLAELDEFLSTNALDVGPNTTETEEVEWCASQLDTDLYDAGSTDSSSSSHTDSKPIRSRKRNTKKKENAAFRANETKRRRMYRLRMKSERDTLQHQVTMLTDQVAELTQRLIKTTNATNMVSSASTWKALARYQREERQQASEEQRRLIVVVSSQAALIQELRAIVLNRLEITPTIDEGVLDVRGTNVRKDEILFGAQISELETNYARTNAVLRAGGVDTMSVGLTMSTFKNPSDDSIRYLQYRGNIHTSLNFEPACKNFWSLAHIRHRRQDREVYDRAKELDNTFAVRFRAIAQLQGAPVSLLQRLVVRRYVTVDYMVLVWRVFVEGEGLYSGMHASDSGWCRLRPIKNGVKDGTVMELCVHQVPMYFGLNPSGEEIARFHEAVIRISKENEEKLLKGLEISFDEQA